MTPSAQKPSVLLVVMEGISGSDYSCNNNDHVNGSGFQVLCDEAIRFTHAFTNSPLAQPAMASILTGTQPLAHHLRDNGKTYLPANITTVPERLMQNDVRTLFVASAPTIKRYSRLHQGFEIFNDEYDFTSDHLYRPISDTTRIFRSWLEGSVRKSRYFAVLHVSDLLFPQAITQTELLEMRPRGSEGQMEEIDEELFSLFTYLKKQNLWNQNYIILTSLNGKNNPTRFNELQGTNLFSENVSIPLFIKPPKGREEIPHQWKVDVHVTLQDLGLTVEEIFGVLSSRRSGSVSQGYSLLPLIMGKSDSRFDNRPILIESAWAQWALNLFPRYSIRDNQWLVILDKKPLLYNTLTDRTEFNRVSLKDNSYKETIDRLAGMVHTEDHSLFEKPDPAISNEFSLAELIVENEGQPINFIKGELTELVTTNPSSQIIKWLTTDLIIRQRNWSLLEEFNKIWMDPLIETFLALLKNEPLHMLPKDCLHLATKSVPTHSVDKYCSDSDMLLLMDWLDSSGPKREQLGEKLVRVLSHQGLQLKIIYFDLSNGGTIVGAQTKGLRDLIMMKMALSLPALQKEAATFEQLVRGN